MRAGFFSNERANFLMMPIYYSLKNILFLTSNFRTINFLQTILPKNSFDILEKKFLAFFPREKERVDKNRKNLTNKKKRSLSEHPFEEL
jgi:hypothetical protein